MKTIQVFRVMETSYENGSYWIEYNVNGAWGYEIVYDIEKLKQTVSDDEIIKKIMDDNLHHDKDVIERLINSELNTGEETKLENARIYYQELFNTDIELNKKLISKHNLSVCCDDLKNYIEDCRQSENEMWYITEEDLEEMFGDCQKSKDNYIKKLQEEAQKLGLEEYIHFYEDDYDIVVFYGGVITQFLFGQEEVDSDIELKIIKNKVTDKGNKITVYENDYYTIKKYVDVNGFTDVTINTKNILENYVHDIFVEENWDTSKIVATCNIVAFKIQTTAYGALSTEEIEKIVKGYNVAIKTVQELEKMFL